MREILFRGKRKDNGRWVYGQFIYDKDELEYFIITNPYRAGIELTHVYFDCIGGDSIFEVIPETVGQYTGIKDKNNKKIFEDDIIKVIIKGQIKYLAGYYLIECWYGQFVFDDYINFRWWVKNNNYENIKQVEVIGNKWDNPELLEE